MFYLYLSQDENENESYLSCKIGLGLSPRVCSIYLMLVQGCSWNETLPIVSGTYWWCTCVHIPVCITCLHDDICYGFPKVLGMPQAIETCPQGLEGIPGVMVQMSGLYNKYTTVVGVLFCCLETKSLTWTMQCGMGLYNGLSVGC